MSGIVEDLLDRTQFDHLSGIQHGNAVGDIRHDTQVMRDENNRVAVLPLQILQEFEDLRLDGHVQRCRRFIADQDLRLAGQCDRDNDTLPHAARILERIIVETFLRVRDPDFLHQFDGTDPCFSL